MPAKARVRRRKPNVEAEQYMPDETDTGRILIYARRGRHRHHTAKPKTTRPDGAEGI